MLATFADLQAIGAIPVTTNEWDKIATRATRLLELASAQVVTYTEYADETALLAAITETQATALAAVVAEVAAQRLNVTAAPSSDPYANNGMPAWALLNRGHKRAIDDILNKAPQGSFSAEVERDATTSYYDWTTNPFAVGFQMDYTTGFYS